MKDKSEKKDRKPGLYELKSRLIAKKDFLICHNKIRIEIKQGDDLEKLKIPKMFMQNLKTEGVI